MREDEEILWRGKPKAGLFFLSSHSLFYIFRTIVWLLTSCVLLSVTFLLYTNVAPYFMFYISGAMALLALFRPLIKFLGHDFRRRRTKYLLTNERVFIWYYSFGKRVKTYEVKKLETVKFRRYSNSYGSILLNYTKPLNNSILTVGTEYRWMDQSRRLEYIENAAKVYTLIKIHWK